MSHALTTALLLQKLPHGWPAQAGSLWCNERSVSPVTGLLQWHIMTELSVDVCFMQQGLRQPGSPLSADLPCSCATTSVLLNSGLRGLSLTVAQHTAALRPYSWRYVELMRSAEV